MNLSEEFSLSKHTTTTSTFENGSTTADAGAAPIESSPSQWSLSPTQAGLSCTYALAVCLVSQTANLGIIYYERVVPDSHRTLVNKVAALASTYQVGATVMFPMVVVRLLLGRGLGEVACRLLGCVFVSSVVQLILSYNELIFLRYLYICRLNTVGMIKEELVMKCATWINLLLGMFVGVIYTMTAVPPGHVTHSFCTNSAIRPVDVSK